MRSSGPGSIGALRARLDVTIDLVGLGRTGRRLRPVFIVGEARSGTTLLYRLLQQQPAFGPDPVHPAESAFVGRLLSARDLEASSRPLRNYLMGDEDAWSRYTRAAAPLLAIRRAVLAVRPQLLSRPRAASVVGLGVLTRSYLALAAEVRDAKRLIEKSPHHTPFTGHLLRWFPDATLLYITRHPIDVLTSYWRRAAVDPRMAVLMNLDLDTFTTLYSERSAIALRWSAERPDAFMLLRYEDLVDRPLEVVETICRFAHAEFAAGAVTAATHSYPVTADPLVWEDVVPRTKDWRDHIDVLAATELERRLKPSMDALGYERYTSDAS